MSAWFHHRDYASLNQHMNRKFAEMKADEGSQFDEVSRRLDSIEAAQKDIASAPER